MILTPEELPLNEDLIDSLTKFGSNTAPEPFPPSIVIFGFEIYPMPGEIIFTSLTEPDTLAIALAPDPIKSDIEMLGPLITSYPDPPLWTLILSI